MSEQLQCACLNVSYSPEPVEFENPVTKKMVQGRRDRWTCDLCGTEYSKTLWHNAVVKQQQDEIERLERRVRNAQGAVVIAKEWIEGKDARIAELEADKKRMDYLESEATREIELTGYKKGQTIASSAIVAPNPQSLFRLNMPISRAVIDERLKALGERDD